MKRWITTLSLLVFCLSLTTSALGESIASRVNAPPSVVLPAFTTPSGMSTITINATVTIPDAPKVPIFTVRIAEISEKNALALADALDITHEQRQGLGWECDVFEDAGDETRVDRLDICQNGRQRGYLMIWRKPDGTIEQSALRYEDSRFKEYFIGTGIPLAPYPAARDGALTRDEALTKALQLVNAVAPNAGYELSAEGAVRGYVPEENLTRAQRAALKRGQGKDPSAVPKVPYAFGFAFGRSYAGIPLTCTADYNTLSLIDTCERWKELGGTKPYRMSCAVSESLNIVVSDEGVYGVIWESPSTEAVKIKEDCELLPFDDILACAKEELIDLFAYDERSYNNEIAFTAEIWDIRFGYMRALDKANDRLILTPVWDFFVHESVERQKDGYTRDDSDAYIAKVTLSAIDGTLTPRGIILN